MNIIEEILEMYESTKFTKEGKQLFLDESKKLLDNYIDERVKLNFISSSLQFKKIEKPNIEEFKQEFFICIENEYIYKKSGEYWTEQQIIDRYKNMYA